MTDTPKSLLSFEPEERGSKVVIRRHAPHYTGMGEIVARRVEMSDAQDIVKAVNAHDDLVATLQWVRANYASGDTKEINSRIDKAIGL